MAFTATRGYSFGATEQVTNAKLHALVESMTVTGIVNAEISASAAIAYSKLTLTGSIVNGDIHASAAIAYSKLALTGSIVNADVSGSAAIAYSKLNLSGSIVNADVATAAAIASTKISLTSSPSTPAANTLYNQGVAKAWVRFNGTGTIAIDGTSYNVSSLVDNGTGDYTINFATAFASVNYVPIANASGGAVAMGDPGTGSVSFVTLNAAGAATDSSRVFVAAFGVQ